MYMKGYVIMRHNALRNTEANMLREVCKDARVEPELLLVNGRELRPGTNSTE